ncbi:MAG: Maltooligosaccharide transport system ATP-binding protein [Methanoculleus marisnigri]|uniref:Molybdate/tungstate import ATP-binding protein WtpC n=1 Tax=Methanoculleus marisnigri TaxID=2198 RepID=A0A101GK39_9EURY|nr:MAG: Maltooligosaccharide transport system ATP-binding protein [Methanoculleus marisnigri]
MLSVHAVRQLRDFVLDITLSVRCGETLVLIGENGAGKSTVLNLISGILTPDGGEITLAGRTLFSDGSRIDVPAESRNIGHLFQSYALFPHMTVAGNVAFGLRCRKIPRPEIADTVAEQLAAMHLSDLADVNVGRLSGGQRQRVALARALASSSGTASASLRKGGWRPRVRRRRCLRCGRTGLSRVLPGRGFRDDLMPRVPITDHRQGPPDSRPL